jgi:glycosyltransferase involved in cell wall biosynthesis
LGKRSRWDIYTWVKFYKLLKFFQPDIVHSFLFTAGFWATLPSCLYKIKGVLYGVRTIFEAQSNWESVLEKLFIISPSDYTTFVSENSQQSYVSRFPNLAAHSCVIRNGISLPHDVITKKFDKSSIIIGAVGRLVKAKGYGTVLHAYKQVQANNPGSQLWIVGEGALRSELENLSSNLDLNGNIVFMGERYDVGQILPLIDIYVSGSLREGIPNAHLEAQAYGKPIVATRVGGVPEILDSKSAILVPPGNVNALAQGILKFINNPELAYRCGQRAREQVSQNFSLGKMVQEYEDLYIKISSC